MSKLKRAYKASQNVAKLLAKTSETKTIRKYLTKIARHYKATRMTVAGLDGKVMYSSDGKSDNLDISDRAYYTYAKSGQGSEWTILSRSDNTNYIVASAPVYTGERKVLSYVSTLFYQL